MASRKRNDAQPTFTSLVFNYLCEHDDFYNIKSLAAALNIKPHNVRISLLHLRKFSAVDSVDSEGRLYWFATPAFDKRTAVQDERRREEPGTRAPKGTGPRPRRRQ